MRRRGFWVVIVGIWILIGWLGIKVFLYDQKEEPRIEDVSYDWQAIVDDDFVCEEEVAIETVILYADIADRMELMSDGMFTNVIVTKEESIKVSLHMQALGKYYEKLVSSYPEVELLFPLLQGMEVTMVCEPLFKESFSLNVKQVNIGFVDLPESFFFLFDVLEEEVQKIMDRVEPMVIDEFVWMEEGLYIRGMVPLRIVRNSVAVFFHICTYSLNALQ